jgi:hypothetical protein
MPHAAVASPSENAHRRSAERSVVHSPARCQGERENRLTSKGGAGVTSNQRSRRGHFYFAVLKVAHALVSVENRTTPEEIVCMAVLDAFRDHIRRKRTVHGRPSLLAYRETNDDPSPGFVPDMCSVLHSQAQEAAQGIRAASRPKAQRQFTAPTAANVRSAATQRVTDYWIATAIAVASSRR